MGYFGKPTTNGQPSTKTAPALEKKRPVNTIRYRLLRAAIWENHSDSGRWFNVTFSRLYKDSGGKWNSSDTFARDDLLLLAKLADLAHTYVSECAGQEAETDETEG